MGAPSVSAVSVRLGDGAGLPTLHHDSAPLRPHLRVAPPVQSPQSAAVTRATSQIDHPVPPPALNPISLAQVDACTDVTVRCRSRTTFACPNRGATRSRSTTRCVSPHLPPQARLCFASRAPPSASSIGVPRPALALLSAAPGRGRGVRPAASARVASGGRGGRSPCSPSRPVSPCDGKSAEGFPSPQVHFDDQHERDLRDQPSCPYPLPDRSTKKAGVGRRRLSFLGLRVGGRVGLVAGQILKTPVATRARTIATRSPPRGQSRKMGGAGPCRGASAARASKFGVAESGLVFSASKRSSRRLNNFDRILHLAGASSSRACATDPERL